MALLAADDDEITVWCLPTGERQAGRQQGGQCLGVGVNGRVVVVKQRKLEIYTYIRIERKRVKSLKQQGSTQSGRGRN